MECPPILYPTPLIHLAPPNRKVRKVRKLSKIKKRLPKLTTADAAGFAAEAWCASGYPEVPAYAKTRTRGLISQAPAGITRPPLPHRCTSGPATVPAETFSEGGAERKSNVRG